MSSLPRLSIVIVTYNSREDIERCLRSLAEHPPVITHEIVVVDNASTDQTPDYIRDRWPAVGMVESGGNRGFGAANNIGLRQSSGELVLFLNPDTIVPAGAVDRLVAALDANPLVAMAGPRIVDGLGHAELSFGSMISPLAELKQKVLVVGNDRGFPLIRGVVERMTRRSRHVDWVSGACVIARRADVEAAGLFDERFFLYTEDVDLCASVRALGKRIQFIAEVEIVHLRGRSAISAPRAVDIAYRRSQIAFYEKHHRGWAPFLKTYLKIRGRMPDTQ
jgi:GT2 family glycosyltransferase